MTIFDRMLDRTMQVVMPKVADMLRQHAPHARDGFIVAGTYDRADGTASVCIANTMAVHTDRGDGPVVVGRVPIYATHVGDQFGVIGDERVVLLPTESGYLALIRHGPDDSPQAPAGERWIGHRNPATGATDVSLKLLNDGAANDGKGGFSAVGGSQHSMQTTGGASRVTSDAAQTITDTSGPASTTLDAVHQTIAHVVGPASATLDAAHQTIAHTVGSATAKLDAIAQSITHQVQGVRTIVDGAGNAIHHIAPSIGLGDFAQNLPSTQAALPQAALTQFESNMHGNQLTREGQQIAAAITAGIPNATRWAAALALLQLAHVGVPNGSSVVKVAA